MSIKIALAGNPNSGKTTLFNALTGSNQFVGNWPGVTVEKKEGKLKGHKDVVITDLPGIYSLSPYSLEEVVARNYLITGASGCHPQHRGRHQPGAKPLPDHPAAGAFDPHASLRSIWRIFWQRPARRSTPKSCARRLGCPMW